MTMKNNKRDELVDELVRWAKEDKENRSVLVLADDESSTRSACNGTNRNLLTGLAIFMREDEHIRQVFADAMLLLEDYEASLAKEQSNDEEQTNND